jgi:hypothetical protein
LNVNVCHSRFTVYYSARKNSGEDLKKALELVVVPMFCNAASMSTATEEQKAKLNKVLSALAGITEIG